MSAERLARQVALLSILISAALAAIKIAAGIAARSVALVSDGLESAADFFTSGMVLIGLWIAAKPADKEHPYGHGRFEILVGLAIGVVLVASGTAISLNAWQTRALHDTPAAFALWPLAGSVTVKAILFAAKLRMSRASGSSGLKADASHDAVDMLSGVVGFIAVVLSVFGGRDFSAADHYGGVVIGLIVIFLGFRVVRETILHLMDTMPDEAQMAEIRAVAMQVPGACGIEKCFARKTGLRYHVDLHLEVDPDLTVRESHEIARHVKNRIKSSVRWVEDVLVHVEPYSGG
ncbi:MAG TPA: cation diffusion facilitator family transporter [Bryobacteraceae bacterium]|jgi:cation diffusion facilitator family transporter|nr:cation diffusion facilitator family transporter [Bryobacteraceae bacterium]